MTEQYAMKTMFVRSARLILVLLIAVLAAACLDRSSDSTGPEPPPEEEVTVDFQPPGADSVLTPQR